MTPHVKIQVVFVLESLAAASADLRSLLSVAQLVGCETCRRAEELPALHALVGQLRRVDLLVGSQLAHSGVHFPALSACKELVLGVSQLVLSQQIHFLKALPAMRTVKLLYIMNTLVSEFLLYGLKAISAFDANISGFCALCPSVSG